MVNTANFLSRFAKWFPKDSIKVLFPAPGTPVIPIRRVLFEGFNLVKIFNANFLSDYL